MGYNYNRDQMVSMLLMTVIVVVGLTSSVKAQPATATCAEKLTSCANYLKNSTNPPASCCNPIKQAVAHELPCLCNLYTTPGFLASIGVNVTQALLLTKNCGVPIELNKCKSTYFSLFYLFFFFLKFSFLCFVNYSWIFWVYFSNSRIRHSQIRVAHARTHAYKLMGSNWHIHIYHCSTICN